MGKKSAATRGLAVMLLAAALATLQLTGCSTPKSAQKVDLTGQLKRLNKQVLSLNDKTSSLVDVIKALDTKEAQLNESVTLLQEVNRGAGEQLETTGELSKIVKTQNTNVASVLGVAQQVLALENGLKSSTEAQLGMSGTTLSLIQQLFSNLSGFSSINQQIINKMDQALNIMSNM